MKDYENRNYLSAVEVAEYLSITVKEVHRLVSDKCLKYFQSASGQHRYKLTDVKNLLNNFN